MVSTALTSPGVTVIFIPPFLSLYHAKRQKSIVSPIFLYQFCRFTIDVLHMAPINMSETSSVIFIGVKKQKKNSGRETFVLKYSYHTNSQKGIHPP